MGYRIGVDIGGSFTDFAVLDEHDNSVKSLKVLSRPDQPGAEIIKGLSILAERDGLRAENVGYFTHGTTVGINSVIQRRGVPLALFTTKGFEDVLELGRLKIVPIHNLYGRRPDPLVPRNRVFGISERMNSDGLPLSPIDKADVLSALQHARAQGAQAIVISFLHGYRNGAHETEVREIVHQEAPDLPVFCSSEIWPIIREYERTITAVISGYVQPKVGHYLTSFESALKAVGVSVSPRITKSNGGVMSVDQARKECVQMVLSGTASGVIGASFVARACNMPRILSLDIGGTSADVAVILDGQPQYGTGEVVGQFQIYIPSVSVTSAGQGGGSIAWVDSLNVLKVGPESAGSSPGPACYGKGGDRATITDAFAVCGLIGNGQLGYSAIEVDRSKAKSVVGVLADRLGADLYETAEDIIRIATSEMYADVSALVSRFGIDPRQFHFLAFGGAGPMMACYLARELNMQGVVVPPTPGVLSALGGLIADIKNDFISTIYRDVNEALSDTLSTVMSTLKSKALDWLRGDQAFSGDCHFTCSADMRYQGQSFEIETPLAFDIFDTDDLDTSRIVDAFHAEHERLYGHRNSDAPVQMINLRLVISGATPKPDMQRVQRLVPGASPLPDPLMYIDAYMDAKMRRVPVYRRELLLADHRFAGPAVVVQSDCTTCILPGMEVAVDEFGNLIISCFPRVDA